MWARVREGQQKVADTVDDTYLVPLIESRRADKYSPGRQENGRRAAVGCDSGNSTSRGADGRYIQAVVCVGRSVRKQVK